MRDDAIRRSNAPVRVLIGRDGSSHVAVDTEYADYEIGCVEWILWVGPLGFRLVWPLLFRSRFTWSWGYWR